MLRARAAEYVLHGRRWSGIRARTWRGSSVRGGASALSAGACRYAVRRPGGHQRAVRNGARRGTPPAERYRDKEAAMSRALIDGLADLHRIDVESAGLGGLGKPEGFLQRQVEGWSDRWRKALTRPVPAMEPVMEWLTAKRPEPRRVAMLHQDYKLDNVMFAPRDPGRMTAVLDWEMATVGDPLADLGLSLTYWSLPEAQTAGMDEAAGW
jgi:aminoglycoside phosphotransferase (APT) family kinase protein